MILAHKIRLDPNDVQATYFAKACGVARFAYNWALAEWKRLYEVGAVVSRKADRWFISVQVEIQDSAPIHTTVSENQAIGVDLGVKDFAILSNGTRITGAKPHKALLSRLRLEGFIMCSCINYRHRL